MLRLPDFSSKAYSGSFQMFIMYPIVKAINDSYHVIPTEIDLMASARSGLSNASLRHIRRTG